MVDHARRLQQLEAAWDRLPDPASLERLVRYRDQPALFQAEVLGRTLYDRQIEVCDAVASNSIVVIPAGRSVGKSYLFSGLVLWYLYTRPGSRVVCTAPDHRQIASVLFSELRAAMRKAPEPLGYEHLSNGYGSPLRLTIDSSRRWEAICFSAQNVEGFSGQHAGELLCLVDESSGVLAPIWDAIDGLVPNKLVMGGNPLHHGDRFQTMHEKAVAGTTPGLVSIPIPSTASPDADKEHSPVGLASASFIRWIKSLHGSTSPYYESNILAKFPGQESVQFFPTSHVDACVDPAILSDPLWLDHAPGIRRMSCDVGGGVGADPSVICVRDDKQLLELWQSEWHGVLDDARFRLEQEIIDRARRWGISGHRVTFDQSGLGRSLGSYLAAKGLPDTIGYYGAGRGGPRFINRRSACAHALRDRLDPARKSFVPFYCGNIPLWPELRKELLIIRDAPMEIQEGFVKQRIEERESVAARLHHSANLADALTQSFNFRGD